MNEWQKPDNDWAKRDRERDGTSSSKRTRRRQLEDRHRSSIAQRTFSHKGSFKTQSAATALGEDNRWAMVEG
jgi:hypothetical protein